MSCSAEIPLSNASPQPALEGVHMRFNAGAVRVLAVARPGVVAGGQGWEVLYLRAVREELFIIMPPKK